MLDKIKQELYFRFFDKKSYIILFSVILFLIVAVYVYKTKIKPILNPSYVANKEYIKDSKPDDTADLYIFCTSWCPHCKSALPIWNNFKNEFGEKKINDIKVNFYEIDCEKNTDLAEKYKIEGYPTIKLVHGNKVITYDAKPDIDTLNQFLKTSLS